MKRVAVLSCVIFAVCGFLLGCESAPEGGEPAGTEEPGGEPTDDPGEEPGGEPGEEPAAGKDDEAKKAAEEFKVPEGVEHTKNPDVKDTPTPTDMPDFADKKAKKAYAALDKKASAGLKKACKAFGDHVVQLKDEGTRIGYVSYKNLNLPVSGLFENAKGYAVIGKKKKSKVHFWIDALSLNSGDDVRTRKLLKLFFELEKKGVAAIEYTSKTIEGELPTEDGKSSDVTFKGELAMYGKKAPMDLTFAVTKSGDGYTAKLAGEVNLLQFAPFGLVAPLEALIKSCNHSAMGNAVDLKLELALQKGCG